MSKIQCLVLASLVGGSVANATIVEVGQSGPQWLGYMNVFELPANGGGFVFGSSWGTNDLVSSFNDGANQLTLSPNSIGDPNEFWYIGGGGPGAQGNKIMEANLYVELTDVLNGQDVTFQGTVLSNTFTSAHVGMMFIRDFAPDYSSSNDMFIPLAAGPFSFTLATDPGAGRHVQYGFQVKGPNVWITDVGPFGTAVIATVPQPGVLMIAGLGGLVATRRRRA